MGSDHSDSAGESFRREDWKEVERTELATTWQNRRDPTLNIQEYLLHLASEEDCRKQREVYCLRKNHPQLVAALYLYSESSSDFCSSSYQQRLFLEKTPIRLADIEHIPYPDFLHLYSQALRGFSELAHHFGPFPVEQEHIAINERGVAKVWVNTDFVSHHPVGGKVSQEDMVRNIVDIIERNLDQGQMPQRVPPVRNYLYRNNGKITFQEALNEFNNFVREFGNGYVPQKLECIDRVGGIYTIANRNKSIQLVQTTVQYPPPQYTPLHYNPVEYSVVNDNRPRLVESGFINGQFQQTAPISHPPSAPPVLQSQQINQAASVLTPSTVRENVPVVRKQAATFSGPFTPTPEVASSIAQNKTASYILPQPIQAPYFIRPIIQQQNVHVVPQQQNAPANGVIQQNRPEPVSVKVGSQQNESKISQNFGTQSIQNQQQANSQANIANNLLNEIKNEGNPTIRPAQPEFFNPQYFQQFNAQNFIANPQNPVSPQTNNINVSSQANNFVNNGNNNSQVIPPQQPTEFSSNYAFNALNAIRNQTPPTINMPAQYTPTYNFNSEPQEPIKAQTESYSNVYSNFNKSQYATVNVDDGKSSLDFFKKLNQIGNFSSSYPVQQQLSSQSFGTVEPPKQQYQNPFTFTETNQSSHKYQSWQNASNSEEQFGRNAVSNIISQQVGYEVGGVDRISEPLKFENNIDMKYSIFEESAPQPTYASRMYETNFDPDLLADLNRHRQ